MIERRATYKQQIKSLQSRCRRAEDNYLHLKRHVEPTTKPENTDPSLTLSDFVQELATTGIREVRLVLSTDGAKTKSPPSTPKDILQQPTTSVTSPISKDNTRTRRVRDVLIEVPSSHAAPAREAPRAAGSPPPANTYVPTALFGPPKPQPRPPPARRPSVEIMEILSPSEAYSPQAFNEIMEVVSLSEAHSMQASTEVSEERSPSRMEDTQDQIIIADRDDGKGAVEEYRPPRRPRNREIMSYEGSLAGTSAISSSSSRPSRAAGGESSPSERLKRCAR